MMHSYVAAAALAGSVSASVLPRTDGCCFQLTASGGKSGTIGQIYDGQNRIGGGLPPATYCISNGEITDSSGRGCILTPPTAQLQCDVGATPTSGFSISGSGEVEYNGSDTFYACGASATEYNLYTKPVENQEDCYEVKLSSGGKCAGNGGAGGSGQSSSASAPKESASASGPPAYSTAPAQSSAPSPASSVPKDSSAASSGANTPPAYTQPQASQSTPQAAQSSVPSPPKSTPQAPQSSAPVPPPSMAVPPKSMAPPEMSAPEMPAPSMPAMQPPVSAPVCPAPITVTVTEACPSGPAAPPAGTAPAASPDVPSPSMANPSAAPPASSPASTPASPPAAGSACPTSLTGAYQTPHLILPISSEKPDVPQGTSYFGEVSSTTSTIFNFDVPAEYAGKQCTLVFMFPEKKDLTTSDYTMSGSGSLGCSELSSVASQSTSYSNAPAVAKDLGDVAIQPGNSYVVATGDCKAGTTQSIELSSKDGLSLHFFQDYNPSPLGLFMTSC